MGASDDGLASSNGSSRDASKLLGALDTNGNGSVSKDEMQSLTALLQGPREPDANQAQRASDSYIKASDLGATAQETASQAIS